MKLFLTKAWYSDRICYGLTRAEHIYAASENTDHGYPGYGKPDASGASLIDFDEMPKDKYMPLETIKKPTILVLPNRTEKDSKGWFLVLVRCESFGRSVHNIGVVYADDPAEAESLVQSGTKQWTRRRFIGCCLTPIESCSDYTHIAETR